MKFILIFPVFLLALSPLSAEDFGTFVFRAAGARFVLHAEPDDTRDYSTLLQTLETRYPVIRDHLNPGFHDIVTVYVYKTQKSLWLNFFKTADMKIKVRAFADHVNKRIHITSIHEDCYPDDVRYKVPVHELTHIIYPHGLVWIREGIANFEAGMFEGFDAADIPARIDDLRFYADQEGSRQAYNFSGWLVRYIVEELSHGAYDKFKAFAADIMNYRILGFEDERDFMKNWRVYMLSMQPNQRQQGVKVHAMPWSRLSRLLVIAPSVPGAGSCR